MSLVLKSFSLDRMVNAVEKVRQRLLRASAALQAAGVPYAVTGGNAVAAWVSRVDESAVRNTQDVDILLRRTDLPAFRDKDRMHLRDVIDVGLVDKSRTNRFPPDLAARLQMLLDTPEG